MGDLPRWINANVDSPAMLVAFEAYLKGLKDEIDWRYDYFAGGTTQPSRLFPRIRTWSGAVNMHRLRHVCLEVCELEHLYQVDHYDELAQILGSQKVTSRPIRPCGKETASDARLVVEAGNSAGTTSVGTPRTTPRQPRAPGGCRRICEGHSEPLHTLLFHWPCQ